MAVVGLDIGDHSTYISLARQGGVDTIANDYTQRATPTIVALGGRQRFMGVSAENQRNLTVKNTVSYFKNFLGRKFKEDYVQQKIGQVGAEVVELQNEQPGFRVQGEDYRPEQLLAMMFTKVRDIVRQDQGEEIATCVVSVPVYFTETQRSAVLDAGKVAGLPIVQLMNDTSALALAYGKTKTEELEEDEAKPRYVVLVDVGASGVQSSLVGVSKRSSHLPSLLVRVRLPLLTPQFLADKVAAEELIRSSHQCRDLLDEARDYHLMPERRPLLKSFKFKPRCCKDLVGVIYAVGGQTKSGNSLR